MFNLKLSWNKAEEYPLEKQRLFVQNPAYGRAMFKRILIRLFPEVICSSKYERQNENISAYGLALYPAIRCDGSE